MIKHILKQIWVQRITNSWLWMELFMVSIFLWFIIDFLYVTVNTYYTPTGFDIEHTYKVDLDQMSLESEDYIPTDKKKTTVGEDYLTIVNRIRNYPGVEAVSISSCAYPYCGANSFNNYQLDTAQVNLQLRFITPDFFRVFRVTTPDGKIESLVSNFKQKNSIVISKDADWKLMGEGRSALGKTLSQSEVDSVSKKVTGICSYIRYSEFAKKYPCAFLGNEESEMAKVNSSDYFSGLDLCIRVSPEADHNFISKFRKDMISLSRVGNFFLLDVKSFADIRDSYFKMTGDFNELKTRMAVIAFLLVNIFLGIIGTFWFRTDYRKAEMGLRLAVGSTRTSLFRLLIAEGVILLTLAIIPAGIISFNIGKADLVDVDRMDFTLVRFICGMLITYLLMAFMIILGIWYPARQAMKIQPAEVLHEQ